MQSYDVTVLVALYRAKHFIANKLEDLARQSIFNKSQIVLLNCQDLDAESSFYANWNGPNIKVIEYQEHVKLYKSWNDGIAVTDSEFIVNANVDDVWHPEYLEKCVNFLRNQAHMAVVSSQVLVTDIPNQVWPNWIWSSTMPELTYPQSTAGPCPMWRRSLHQRYGQFEQEYNVISDALMWETWHNNGEQFGIIKEPLVLYYYGPHSLERRHENGSLLRDQDLKLKYGQNNQTN